jgi:hypothetical protein
VFAKNFGKLPVWHQGYGGDAFILLTKLQLNKSGIMGFVDENDFK